MRSGCVALIIAAPNLCVLSVVSPGRRASIHLMASLIRDNTNILRADDRVQTLYAISDVHVDAEANRKWIEGLEPRPRDALILAGDVSHDLECVQHTFRCLKAKFREVYFCPGNHDLWVQTERDDDMATSIDKLHKLLSLADSEGVRTRPHVFGGTPGDQQGGRHVLVVPMLSWHHAPSSASFDTEPAISHWRGIPSARFVMSDYRRCRWPEPLRDDDESVARFFDGKADASTFVRGSCIAGLNCDVIPMASRERQRGSTDVVSFSHFLPRIELLPEKRYLYLPTLTKAVGSRFLGDRVRALQPDAHCFGHTHIAWDSTIAGVRYIQAALAYEQEWRSRPASLAIGDLASENSKRPVKIWDSVNGIVSERYHTSWSEYYERYPRVPTITNILPPYSARLYRPLPGSEVKPVGEHVAPYASVPAPSGS